MISLKPNQIEFVNETRVTDDAGRVSTNSESENIDCYLESSADLQIYVNGKERTYNYKIVVLERIGTFTHVVIEGEKFPIVYQKVKQLHTEIYA